MKINSSTHWTTNYRAFIGPLSEQTAEAWSAVIMANINPAPDITLINRAVANLCEGHQSGRWDDKPGVRSIIGQIWNIIKGRVRPHDEIHIIDHGTPYPYKSEMISMQGMKDYIRNATTPEERWTLICMPVKAEDCQVLAAFASTLATGFVRFHPPAGEPDIPALAAAKTYDVETNTVGEYPSKEVHGEMIATQTELDPF